MADLAVPDSGYTTHHEDIFSSIEAVSRGLQQLGAESLQRVAIPKLRRNFNGNIREGVFVGGGDRKTNILSSIDAVSRGLQNVALPKFSDLLRSLVDARARLLSSLARKEAVLKVRARESFHPLSVTDDRRQGALERNSSFPGRNNKDGNSNPEAEDFSCDAASLSSIGLPVVEFEVFLSFRGPDTRRGFADCLYYGLFKAGIRVFRDVEGLHIGDNLRELLVAINNSKICIPILSRNYASSRWCLQELVQMIQCSKSNRVEIFPIFYDVKPSEVQLENGPYVEALQRHKKQFGPKIVRQWEDALREIGRIKGWELQKATDGHEGKLIEMVVRRVLVSLKVHHLNVTDHLVAVDDHATRITRMLNVDSRDVRTGGIHGMGGIGKTTLAKVVYNQLSRHFEYCCFIADVRETSQHKGLEYLQNQLVSQILKDKAPDISNVDEGMKIIKERLHGKEVLVLLDDVDKRAQLNALVGNRSWFGSGSKIIITTRKKDILNVPEVDWRYELSGMDFEPSLLLFSRHAFRRDYPPDDYLGYSEKIVEITGGLPLALESIGSFLSGQSNEVWSSTLKKLEKLPHDEVEKKLRISYDALDDLQKHIFLDIACMFIGYDRRIAVHMWDDSQFFPEEGIEVLLLMSLIKIVEDNKLWMHDQLRDLGRKIVYQENNFEPGRRSRLWNHHKSIATLEGKKGSELIQALCLKSGCRNEYRLTNEEFVTLSNLRFLQINGTDLSGNFESLLPELRWLCWHYCPSRFLPTNFHSRNLVVLDLSWSKITEDWDGWRHIKTAKRLKVMNLTGCTGLSKIPDFSGFVALERLILKGCEGLLEVDISLADLRHLNSLNIQDCYSIQKLPESLCYMESLRELIVDGTSIQEISVSPGCLKKLESLSARNCKSLVLLSSSIGYLESLTHLTLDNSRITRLPDSIGELIKLERLSLRECRLISELPGSIGKLEALEFLDLSFTGITGLPGSVGKMKHLKVLILEGSRIGRIPPVIGMLEKLEELHAKSCSNLEGEIPSDIGNLLLLRILSLSDTGIHALPGTISRLSNLHTLDMDVCNKLRVLPELPTSLVCLRVSSHSMEEIPDLSDLNSLNYLYLSDNSQQREPAEAEGDSAMPVHTPSPRWIGMLTKLETLHLSISRITDFPGEISRLSRLKKLVLFCVDLQRPLHLPPNLSTLSIGYSKSVSVLSDLSNLKNLLELELLHSPISDIHGLGDLASLQVLDVTNCGWRKLEKLGQLGTLRRLNLHGCNSLQLLPDLSALKKLKEVRVRECEKLIRVEGLSRLESLEVLQISGCGSLEQFDDPSQLKLLKLLEVKDCDKLQETLSSSLGRLPDMSRLKRLSILELESRKPTETELHRLTEPPNFKMLKYLYTEDPK